MKIISKLYTASSTIIDDRPLENVYRPLNNIVDNNIKQEFVISNINLNLTSSTEILSYPSYDGSVNLFITNGDSAPIVVNTGFAKLENDKCRIIERLGTDNTNEYDINRVGEQVQLFTTVNKYPKIGLKNVSVGGQLPGGNYTLYFKYGDKDGNKTDVIGESSIISVFYGSYETIPSIKGTLSSEKTDKMIDVELSNIDVRFSKLYVYVHWESSDLDGNPISSTYELIEPFNLDGNDTYTLSIYGTETKSEIPTDELNIQYNIYNNAKTQTTVQNMLFLGNLGHTYN